LVREFHAFRVKFTRLNRGGGTGVPPVKFGVSPNFARAEAARTLKTRRAESGFSPIPNEFATNRLGLPRTAPGAAMIFARYVARWGALGNC
jgi:hypothetical protein